MEQIDKFTKTQFEYKYRLIHSYQKRNKVPDEKPRAYIMGGQPGAGKSTLCSYIERNYLNNNAIISFNV